MFQILSSLGFVFFLILDILERKRRIRGNLGKNYNFWAEDLKANKFILDVVSNGYKLPFESLPERYEAPRNNFSAIKNADFVTQQVEELLEGNFIKEVEDPPFCVNPLTVAENAEKLRLVLDLGHVNAFLAIPRCKYEDLRNFSDMVQEGDYAVKFDLTSGYHHIEIHEQHRKFLGFKWFYRNKERYFVFEVLPFGLSSACHVFTKVMRAFIKKWRGAFGLRTIIYIDDGICVEKSFKACSKAGKLLLSDLKNAGFIVNLKKSIWIPTKRIQFLGFAVDTDQMTYTVPDKKLEVFLNLASKILKSGKASAKDISRVTGRLVSMQPALGKIVLLTTRCMYAFLAKQSTWYREGSLDQGSLEELEFWFKNIRNKNGYRIKADPQITRVIFTDASEFGFGGFLVTKIGQEVAKGTFSAAERQTSSTEREILAVKYVLQSFQNELRGQNILWYTDNQNVPIILRKGSTKMHLNKLALDIFSLALKLSVELLPVWIPREENKVADALSKSLDTDAWCIDQETFQYIEQKFGQFTVDRFADNRNARVQKFDAKYFCPGVQTVNTFAANWAGEFNWVCPPISQIGRALRHFEACKAAGVLCIPEWRSAYFWPLLVENNGTQFREFVKGFLLLDPFYSSSNECAESSIFQGFMKFRTLALLVKFE